jgi:cytochrome c-type biogenesis protein CcmH
MSSPRRTSRTLGAAAFVACLLAALAPGTSAAAPRIRASLPQIERQVMCVTCKIPLMVAESPQADREKEFIQSLIARGEDEAQIKRALVNQYGTSVLGMPPASGFDLTVYLVPALVVLALLALFVVLLPRWRRRARARAASQPSPTKLAAADAARLESDLARFE